MGSYSGIPTPLILVADDSRTILSMVASRLERSGYEVVTTANGEDALQLAEKVGFPAWVAVDPKKMTGTFKGAPDRSEFGQDINESLVVELYSK